MLWLEYYSGVGISWCSSITRTTSATQWPYTRHRLVLWVDEPALLNVAVKVHKRVKFWHALYIEVSWALVSQQAMACQKLNPSHFCQFLKIRVRKTSLVPAVKCVALV